ncbi:unnamed protein product [Clavelina lepadiformis]|uniref:Carbohydrate sulfotransferase n=2 Tax=Clavelina lepadiformis TaxID=159417 RepID=A0ABP0FPI7_CLALP
MKYLQQSHILKLTVITFAIVACFTALRIFRGVNTIVKTENNRKMFSKIANEHTKKEDFMQNMDLRIKERKKNLKIACKESALNSDYLSEMQLLFYEKYKLAYCVIPKSGCSNMKKLLLNIDGYNTTTLTNGEIHEISRTKYLRKGMPDIVQRENYLKVILVRHPYERLVSSYNNKIRFPYNDQFLKYSEKMKELYGNSSQNSEAKSAPLFEEFVKYVSDGRNQGYKNGGEMHWNTYTSLCNPCHVEYDVILHLETIKDDVRYLLELVGAHEDNGFSSGYSKSGQSKTEQKNYVEEYFKQLIPSLRHKLYKAYKNDFKLFGYSPDRNAK